MASATLTLGGAATPSSRALLGRQLHEMLVELAERELLAENPALYFAPGCDTVVVEHDLTPSEELVRQACYLEDRSIYEARLEVWRVTRALWLSERVRQLFERYRVESLQRPLSLKASHIPGDLRRWMRRQLAKGAWEDPPRRVYLYLVLKDLAEDVAAHKAAPVESTPLTVFNREAERHDPEPYDGFLA